MSSQPPPSPPPPPPPPPTPPPLEATPPAAAAAAFPAAPPAPHRNPAGIGSPGVNLTLTDGTEINISSEALRAATVDTRTATPFCPYTHLLIFDGG
jgi:hypothetical protein